ncbi:MAG: hypothetical protein KDB14_13765 [Planctomycetales bacterium]|nr:hypothetical protein [Planctomycetales bacterium]
MSTAKFRTWRWGAIVLASVACLALIAWGGFSYALRYQPSFYRQALAQTSDQAQVAGAELERELLGLHNQVRHEGRWKLELSTAEINGWLGVDLPEKLPRLLPPEVTDPRVSLCDGQLLIAARYHDQQDERSSRVISLHLDVSATSTPNELALRVDSARLGAVPLPLSKLIERVSEAARRQNIRLRWSEEAGRPLALLTLAPRHPEFPDQAIRLDSIHIEQDRLAISGDVVKR